MTQKSDCTNDNCNGTIHATGTKLKHGFECDTCNNSFQRNF